MFHTTKPVSSLDFLFRTLSSVSLKTFRDSLKNQNSIIKMAEFIGLLHNEDRFFKQPKSDSKWVRSMPMVLFMVVMVMSEKDKRETVSLAGLAKRSSF